MENNGIVRLMGAAILESPPPEQRYVERGLFLVDRPDPRYVRRKLRNKL